METPNYSLSQSISCQVIRTLWGNCKNNIGPMHELKASYTEELCTQRIAETNAADALPDEAAIAAVHEEIREALVGLGRSNRKKWKRLKSYINGAYKEESERIVQYKKAGWKSYKTAAVPNWQAINDLMQAGSNYITENLTVLRGTDNNNMPAGFPQEFNDEWDAYKLKRQEFVDALNASPAATAAKIKAINECYAAAIDMGADGQTVFEDDEEMRKLFSFAAQGELADPPGPASFEVLVLVNGLPKPGAEISIENTDKEQVTNSEGKALFTQMHEGPLQALVECDGHTPKTVAETLAAGVRKRITVTLEPLFSGALTVGSEQPEIPAAETPVTEAETAKGSVQ